jgi:hypothetical protein
MKEKKDSRLKRVLSLDPGKLVAISEKTKVAWSA